MWSEINILHFLTHTSVLELLVRFATALYKSWLMPVFSFLLRSVTHTTNVLQKIFYKKNKKYQRHLPHPPSRHSWRQRNLRAKSSAKAIFKTFLAKEIPYPFQTSSPTNGVHLDTEPLTKLWLPRLLYGCAGTHWLSFQIRLNGKIPTRQPTEILCHIIWCSAFSITTLRTKPKCMGICIKFAPAFRHWSPIRYGGKVRTWTHPTSCLPYRF